MIASRKKSKETLPDWVEVSHRGCILYYMKETMNQTKEINNRVLEAIANGERVIRERNTYRQHLLREHPNVCRQTERYTDQYVIHAEPCGCPPVEATKKSAVAEVMCCFTVQPVGSECWDCGQELSTPTNI